jgi:tripartite-type tricarboxylate transporter receptor subunit TctC
MIKLLAILLVTTGVCHAGEFLPYTKVTRVIIPFTPGGGTTLMYKHFEKYCLDQNIKLQADYKGGADGVIGAGELAKSPTDGHTIMFGSLGSVANYRVYNTSYEFEYVSMVRSSIMVVVASNKSGITSFGALEKELRKSDTKLTFAYGAPGQKVMLEQLFTLEGLEKFPIMVPYKGAGLSLNDLVGGHVDSGFLVYGAVKQHIDSGNLVPLAITTQGTAQGINLPVINQKFPKWEFADGFIIVLPKGASDEVVAFWRTFVQKYLQDPQTLQDFSKEYTFAEKFGPDYARQLVNKLAVKFKNDRP